MTSGYSVRRRILGAAVVMLGVLAAIVGISAGNYAAKASNEAFDRVLEAASLTISDAVQVDQNGVTVDMPYAALAILGRSHVTRVFYRVSGPDNAFLTGYADLGFDLGEATSSKPHFQETTYRGTPIRLVRVGTYISSAEVSGWTTIMVGETLEARQALAAEIFRNAFFANLGIASLALLLVFFGLNRAFAPFRSLREELRQREPTDLSGIRAAVPQELAPLVHSLNDFMWRLKSNLQRLRMIVADAAHQVRTPLASLRAQAELAMDETDTELLRKRVSRIHANAVAASQIVNQLLSEATVMHQQETTAPRSTDLEVLVNDMVAHMDPVEAERIVTDDSGLRDNERPMVSGAPVALRELLRNLIENALRYSEGEVRVCFAHEGGELVVRVLDRGPGIPDYEKTCLRERFWRGSASNMAQGSGLGLSIVSSVVEASGGRLEFLDREGGGLQVELHWPDRRGQR